MQTKPTHLPGESGLYNRIRRFTRRARRESAESGECLGGELPDHRLSGARQLRAKPQAGVWHRRVFRAAGGGDLFHEAVQAAE